MDASLAGVLPFAGVSGWSRIDLFVVVVDVDVVVVVDVEYIIILIIIIVGPPDFGDPQMCQTVQLEFSFQNLKFCFAK